MQGSDELILLAELGAAFAGFLAIFLIFARRDGRFSPTDSLAVRSMILGSFMTLFLALAPLVLAALEIEPATVWRVSSALTLLVIVLVAVNMARAHRRIPRDARGDLKTGLVVVAWTLATTVAVLSAINLLGLAGSRAAGVHLASLVAILGITAVNFSDIAFKRLI